MTLPYMQAFMDRASATKPDKKAFVSSIDNFYMTDVISRSSQTMAKCVQARGTMEQQPSTPGIL